MNARILKSGEWYLDGFGKKKRKGEKLLNYIFKHKINAKK